MRGLAALAIAVIAVVGCHPAPPAYPRALPPLTAEAYAAYLRGRTALYEGDAASALAAFEEAAALAPAEAGIAVARAEAMYSLGARVLAAKAITAATRRWPRSPEVWLAAGRIDRGASELRQAIAAFERAIALDPSLADAYLGLASTHTQAQAPARAEAALDRLVAAVPESAEGHHRLAELALGRGDDLAAEPHLRQVVALAPDHVEDRLALAALAYRGGRLHEAIALARQATSRSGDDLAVARDLLALLLEAGDRAGALAVLDGYDRAVPVEQQVGAGWMLLQLGELDRVRAVARAAGERGAATDVLLARAWLADGELGRARAAADRVPADDATWADAQVVAVEAAWASGELATARTRAEAGLRRFPEHVELLAALAETLRRAGDVDAGRAVLTAAARAQPHDQALAADWSGFEDRAVQPAAALELAERLLAADPDDPAAQDLVGHALVAAGGDLPRARALLTRARAHAPGDAGVLADWGWLLHASGDLPGAAAALDRALAITPFDAELVVHAATVAVERGDQAGAAGLLAMVPVTAGPELRAAAAALRARLTPLAWAPAGASVPAPSCYARMRMRTPMLIRLVAGTVLGSMLALSACSKTPSKGQCEQLLTHLIDLEAGAGGTTKLPDDATKEVDRQKKAIREYALGQKFMDTCTHKTPKKVVECGIAAKTADDIAKCDQK